MPSLDPDVLSPRPSAPVIDEDAELDEALRESFPASDPPAIPVHHHHEHHAQPPEPAPPPEPAVEEPRAEAAEEKVSLIVEQTTLAWSPTAAPAILHVPFGEPPHAAETPPHDEPIKLRWRYKGEDYDLVDEAVAESFPASDPPSWTLGRE